MKRILVFGLWAVFLSCTSDDDLSSHSKPEAHHQLKDLKRPKIILNDLAKGELNSENKIVHAVSDFPGGEFYFKYMPNSRKFKQITYSSNGSWCVDEILQFYYRDDLIDSLEFWENSTGCEKVLKTYRFNYEDGLLKNITYDNSDYFIEESYFSYNEDGTIHQIFHSFRDKDVTEYEYTELTYFYDENQNLVELFRNETHSDEYDKRYTYTYDSEINPFKGNYPIKSLLWTLLGYESFIGPAFLSNNNLQKCVIEYVSSGSRSEIYYETDYDKGRLTKFGDDNFTTSFYYK